MEIAWTEVEDNEKIKEEFSGYQNGLVRCTPGGWTMKPETADMVPTYSKMTVRPSDVWVVTYPKCGTTWTQEMVWQVVNKVDMEGGKVDLGERFPFLEFDTLAEFHWIFPGIRGTLASFAFSSYMWWVGLKWFSPITWFGFNNFVEWIAAMPETKRRFIKSRTFPSLCCPIV